MLRRLETQAVAAVIATTLSPSVFAPTIGVVDLQIAVFASVQAIVSAFVISLLFQNLYRRIKLSSPASSSLPSESRAGFDFAL
jgi:hypothetical protein